MTSASASGTSGDVHLLQPDVRADAHHRDPGHAPARRRVRGEVRRLEPVHLDLRAFILGFSTLIFLYNMVVSWRGGPRAPSNPWRGDDARVAGLLATADLQLRRDPDGRRRPLRVRRPGRGARHLQAARRGRARVPAGSVTAADRARRAIREDDPRRRQRDAGRHVADRGGPRHAAAKGDVRFVLVRAPDPAARGAGRLRRRRVRRRPGARRSRARVRSRRAHRRDRRGRRSATLFRDDRRRPRATDPTRSSSRPIRRRARAGFGAT